ncbi:conserved hypothetical protein [Xenorhabdus szentirmaii DSM 16338]|uniref:Uncharacterized protein n=1 Tax=Xenorhabdus szentirmaii DSM 16338 TaxID=1427518 RepID=W1IZV3_9GAMM|nr:conserved hypothetical protein [Xenorhabdus szentirmaii DSM 16338]
MCKGWHFNTRFTVNQLPFIIPNLRNASMPYWEQVGLKRQRGPSSGLITNW